MLLPKRKNQAGFTIIEFVVIILIIVILVSIIIPTLLDKINKANIAATKSNITSLRIAAKLYHSENNKTWPESIKNMVDAGYLKILPKEMFTTCNVSKIIFVATHEYLFHIELK